ncbi:hypothetical protein CN600_05215 [Bacillus mycoides]|nr:hypothetical protein CN600_05215 [Bacillus mycoides]
MNHLYYVWLTWRWFFYVYYCLLQAYLHKQLQRKEAFFKFYNQQNFEITQNRKFYEAMYDQDHHLVRIEKEMNWNIVYKLIKPFYQSPVGRPSVVPLIIVKILLIQYVEGFRSVRFTCKQVKQNATYR